MARAAFLALRLQRGCYRLIWLNLLLGIPGYQPLVRDLQVALSYVDAFLPLHNLTGLEDLAHHLALLDERLYDQRLRNDATIAPKKFR